MQEALHSEASTRKLLALKPHQTVFFLVTTVAISKAKDVDTQYVTIVMMQAYFPKFDLLSKHCFLITMKNTKDSP